MYTHSSMLKTITARYLASNRNRLTGYRMKRDVIVEYRAVLSLAILAKKNNARDKINEVFVWSICSVNGNMEKG